MTRILISVFEIYDYQKWMLVNIFINRLFKRAVQCYRLKPTRERYKKLLCIVTTHTTDIKKNWKLIVRITYAWNVAETFRNTSCALSIRPYIIAGLFQPFMCTPNSHERSYTPRFDLFICHLYISLSYSCISWFTFMHTWQLCHK